MTYETLINNVRAKFRTDPNKRIITDAVVGLFLNDGQRIIERKADWPFAEVSRTFSTSIGSQEYTLSTIMREVTIVQHQDRELPLNLMDYAESKLYGTASGTPYAYYVVGKNKIGFVNIPANVRTITYSGIRYFPAITSTTASIIPDQDQDLLEIYALAQCYKTLNQLERGNDKMGEFYDGLAKMEENYTMRVPGGDYRIKDPEEFDNVQENTFNYFTQ